ncbi:NAD-dependent epimerase/dehydratase family protein [bacterium]|nr:MAG: NAD-dependent epimerase/dehydratase family protein [bacterium]
MSLSGATVLVTGAYGFIGRGVVDGLLGAGASVVAVGRDAKKAAARLPGGKNLRFLQGDVAEPLKFEGPLDYVVHAASPATPKVYVGDPLGALSANVWGTRNLLELAEKAKVRKLLYLSSCEVYQTADPLSPRACYAEGKRMGETLCGAYHRQRGVPAVVARLFHTYGPGMDLADGRVFADFVADAVAKRPISLQSDGLDRRPFCYLSDAVRALLTLLEKGEPGQAYDLANDEAELSVRELAELMVRLFPDRCPAVVGGKPPAGYVPSPVRRYSSDVSKLKALGWSPSVGPEEGFRRTVESYL